MRGEHVEDMLEHGETVGTEYGPGDDQGGQPRMAPQDGAGLLADADEIGQPVSARRG